MNAKLRRRLDLLERNTHLKRSSVSDEITTAALRALSDEDLDLLHSLADREPPFSGCTPEQKAALDRCQAEYEAAALRITGQRPSYGARCRRC